LPARSLVNGAGDRAIPQVERRLYERGGRFSGRLIILRDITERKRAEEALKEYSERLEEGEYRPGHPVAQAWLTQTLSPEEAGRLQEAVQSAARQACAEETGFSGKNPVSLVDLEWMVQVLDNLVENAIYYTPEGGTVMASTGTKEAEGRTWATVTVADTGMGIPEDELPHIFDRFFRGVEPRSMQISGTGLGLAIVKEIVELHGGWVTAESPSTGSGQAPSTTLKTGEEGVGSTFTVWLPLAG